MPVNIGVNTRVSASQPSGFGTALVKDIDKRPEAEDGATNTQRAANTLRGLKAYIRDSKGTRREGNIRVVNTTNNKELKFAYKSYGWGPQYRKDRTVSALVVLLNKAGVSNAAEIVNQVMRPNGSQGAWPALSAQMLEEVLNHQDVKAKLQESDPGKPQGVGRQGVRIDDMQQSEDAQLLQPPGPQASDPGKPQGAGRQGVRIDDMQQPEDVQLLQPPGPQALSPRDEVMNLVKDTGFQNVKQLGKGGFGTAFTAELNGNTHVVKLLTDKKGDLKAAPLESQRNHNVDTELYAAYLDHSRDPNWTRPLVEAPTHYIVQSDGPGQPGYRMIPVSAAKAEARNAQRTTGKPLQCVGLVMNKAPGENLGDLIADRTQGNHKEVGRMARSALETLHSLNQRGFVHRDIKPANMNYNASTGKVHFFDTGAMFKVRKVAADQPGAAPVTDPDELKKIDQQRLNELPESGPMTMAWLHPAALGKQRIGTQRDLHALGLVLLEAAYPKLNYSGIRRPSKDYYVNKNGKMAPNPVSFAQIMLNITDIAGRDPFAQRSPQAIALQQDAQRFLNDLKDPNSLGNLIGKCLLEADTTNGNSVAKWANRTESGDVLQRLMNHPALPRPVA